MMTGDHHPPPPTSTRNHQKHREAVTSAFVVIIAAFSFVALIVHISIPLEPKKPQFDLQQVGVQYVNFSVINATTTTTSVSLAIRMKFMALNDNGVSIKYGRSLFNITYRGIPLGWATLPGFDQCGYNANWVQTTVTVDRVNVHSADFVRDVSRNDRVELRIMGDVNVNVPTRRAFGTRTTTVSVDCVIAISLRKKALTCKLCGTDVLKE